MTQSELEAYAEVERDKAAREERRDRRQGRATLIGLACLAILMMVGIPSCINWSERQERQREAACEAQRDRALELDRKAGAVRIPMVHPHDAPILNLQLRGTHINLGDLDLLSEKATEHEIAAAYKLRRQIAGQAARVVLEHQSCMKVPGLVEAAERIEKSPLEVARVQMPSPARCADGSLAKSIEHWEACHDYGSVHPGLPVATLHFD
ncbi:hypothetical protein V1460_21550 [Streptomyces sp. SCSIO 30461]|uniref:hypothetical protein n=1 Tax=Streptomyces sp. SCSIO 30461 TaxID=3118085 RepID=UPI0030CE7070